MCASRVRNGKREQEAGTGIKEICCMQTIIVFTIHTL